MVEQEPGTVTKAETEPSNEFLVRALVFGWVWKNVSLGFTEDEFKCLYWEFFLMETDLCSLTSLVLRSLIFQMNKFSWIVPTSLVSLLHIICRGRFAPRRE